MPSELREEGITGNVLDALRAIRRQDRNRGLKSKPRSATGGASDWRTIRMWECKIVQFDEKISLEAIEAELNRLGRECWELVSFDCRDRRSEAADDRRTLIRRWPVFTCNSHMPRLKLSAAGDVRDETVLDIGGHSRHLVGRVLRFLNRAAGSAEGHS
jgi:hypothetical protein